MTIPVRKCNAQPVPLRIPCGLRARRAPLRGSQPRRMDCNRARRPHRHALLRLLLLTCVQHEIYCASSENSTAKAPVPPEVETTAAAQRLALESEAEAEAEAYREFLRRRRKREAQEHAAQQ